MILKAKLRVNRRNEVFLGKIEIGCVDKSKDFKNHWNALFKTSQKGFLKSYLDIGCKYKTKKDAIDNIVNYFINYIGFSVLEK